MAVFFESSENQHDEVCYAKLRAVVLISVAAVVILILNCITKRWRQPDKETDIRYTKIAAKREFIARNEEHYGYPKSKKGFIDEWRLKEFPSLLPPLEQQQHQNRGPNSCAVEPEVYLDYAGSALPTRSQLCTIYEQCVADSANTQILANPHSLGGGIASDRTWKIMQQSIHCAKKHFGVNDEYVDLNDESNDGSAYFHPAYRLVFTSGATESLRLVAEHFPWKCVKILPVDHEMSLISVNAKQSPVASVKVKSMLVYPKSSHTSVIGIRHVALDRGAQFHCAAIDELLNATSVWFQGLIEQNIEAEESAASDHAFLSEEKKQTEIEITDEPDGIVTKTVWVHNLLALPVECNFGGDRFDWSSTVAAARASICTLFVSCKPTDSDGDMKVIKICHKWHVLFDTAKAAATSEVNLATIVPGGPDFAIASFYKMFGHPTGIGALFIKKQKRNNNLEREDRLPQNSENTMIETKPNTRHYFGGGSVDIVLPHLDFTVPRRSSGSKKPSTVFIESYHAEEETIVFDVPLNNGTQHFRGISELINGFQELESLGGMLKISQHATCLAAELVRRLKLLRHNNKKPVISIYGQWRYAALSEEFERAESIGPTVAFNIIDQNGSLIGYDEVSRLASLNRPPIQLRTGCFCNPGACQDALSLKDEDLIDNWRDGHVCGDRRGIINGRPTGCIRASFGKDSIWEDMDALVSFIEKIFVSQETVLKAEKICAVSTVASKFKIDCIYVFPIKSCAAMQVNRWPIECGTGKLLFDREFALVDASGVAMRLSSYPKMSQIQPIVDIKTNTLSVSSPGHKDLLLSLEKVSNLDASAKDVEVCGILCTGNIWGGREASDWFTSVLGVRCWLARHYEDGKMKLTSERVRNNKRSYSNEAALLLVSQQSVDVLNSTIQAQGWGRQINAAHFRPNIVVSVDEIDKQSEDGQHPEDTWERIVITTKSSQVELLAAGKCARCQMVDIDPTSGMKGNTLRALAQYRRERGRIYFGTFFTGVHDNASKNVMLMVGDEVQATPTLQLTRS